MTGPDHDNGLVRVRCLGCGHGTSNDHTTCPTCGHEYGAYAERLDGDDEPRPWQPTVLRIVT